MGTLRPRGGEHLSQGRTGSMEQSQDLNAGTLIPTYTLNYLGILKKLTICPR